MVEGLASPASDPLEEGLTRALPRLRMHLSRRGRRIPGVEQEDLIQEVLARALRYRESFDSRRDLWPWLRRLADRVLCDQRTAGARDPASSNPLAAGIPEAHAALPEPTLDAREELERARAPGAPPHPRMDPGRRPPVIVLSFVALSCLCSSPQSDAVRVASRAEPAPVATPPGTELRLHAAGELTGEEHLRDLAHRLVPTGSAQTLQDSAACLEQVAELRRSVAITAESLLATVRDRIEPPLANGQRVELVDSGTLALIGDARQQGWLASFLAEASAFHGLVELQARIYVTKKGTLPRSCVERSGQVLAPGEAERLLVELDGLAADVLVAPRVLSFPFQETLLTAVDQIPYIKDYELQILPDSDTEIADPVIVVADSGVRLRLRSVPLAAERLGIYANLDYSNVAQPIQTATVHLGRTNQEVTVQLPDITSVHVEGHFDVSPGATVLLSSSDPTGAREVLILLKTTRVEAHEDPGK